MNSKNNVIIDGVIKVVNSILNTLTEQDQRGYSLKLDRYEVVDDGDMSLGDLMEEELTLESKVKLYITETRGESGEKLELVKSVFVPKMINGLFVIEGKKRVSSNTLNNSSVCRLYPDKIYFDDERQVLISREKRTGKRYPYSPKYLTLSFYDINGKLINVPTLSENFEIYRNFLKLTPDQQWRLQIKLDINEVGEYITEDLVHKLYDLGPDAMQDSIIDKKITTIDSDFAYHINSGLVRWPLIRLIGRTWRKTGELSFNALDTAIKSYFKVAKSKCVEIPSTINPLIYDSLKYKVSLPANIMYNESFVDLIDASNTPENNNVNILNELNVATSIENGVIYYTCYDYKTKKQLKIPYLLYLTKPVLKCDYWDYDNMKLKDGVEEVVYRLRLRDHRCSSSEIDNLITLIEPKPDDRLSYTTRRMPLVNMSDSVRVSMGAAMIRQSIQTKGCEPRLVQSGNDDEDILSSANLISYSGINTGTVERVDSDQIIIKDDVSGMIVPMAIPNPVVGSNDSTMTYESIVKSGDKVIPGQVVIEPRTMKGGTYNLGINARAVYMNYLGMTYEDGVVVSQSYANKCTHYSVIRVSAKIKSSDQIRDIVKIGQKVVSKDYLIRSISTLRVRESIQDMVQGQRGNTVFKALDYTENRRDIVTPNNTDEGYVVDIKIINNPNRKIKLGEYSQKIIDQWKQSPNSETPSPLPDEYKRLTAQDQAEFEGNTAAIINIVIVRVNRMKVGDKSSNTWGGKGEIALIVPDELMPRVDEDGQGNGTPFEIIMNPPATIARKNPSQLYELVLTKCIRRIFEDVQYGIAHDDVEVVKKFTEEYYGDRFTKMTNEEFINAAQDIHNFAMKVGSYSKIDYNTVLKWCDDLDVKQKEYIYAPDVFIYEGPTGRTVCSPEYAREHNLKGKYYELGFVEEPVVCGESYMYKLYHAADYVGKCTPAKSRQGDPLMGRGLFRGEGQSIGEMESWALMSRGATKLITHDNPEIERDEHRFLNELMLTGFVMMDNYGVPIGSPVRNRLIRNANKD